MSVMALGATCLSSRAVSLVSAWGDNSYSESYVASSATHVKAVAAGYDFSLALNADGTLMSWGMLPVPTGLSNITAIAGNGQFALALDEGGNLTGWGDNSFGQTVVPVGYSNITAVAAGESFYLALRADGQVFGQGQDFAGQIDVPPGLTGVTAIACGVWHSLALKADGTVVAWGDNSAGQTNVPAGLTNVRAIAAGAYFSVALKGDGTVVAWGNNNSGETNVPAGLTNVRAIAAGTDHVLALKSDGTVVAWGDNYAGQINVPPGLSNVTAIAAGGQHSLAVTPFGPVQILQTPTNLVLFRGSNATFSVTATGSQPLSYRWLMNGQPLANPSAIGVNSSTLTITNVQLTDTGTYTLLVNNAFGTVLVTGVTLTVLSPPYFTGQSPDRTVVAGTNLTLSVGYNGTLPIQLQWFLNGTPLAGVTNAALSLTNLQSTASGTYAVVASNLYGIAEADIHLTVTDSPPYLLTQPVAQTKAVGGQATLTASARGSTPLTYQWRFNGEDIPGATGTSLVLNPLTYPETGFYSVAVSNAFGDVVSAKVLLSVAQAAVWKDPAFGLGEGPQPTNVPPGLTNLVAVAAGSTHVSAITADGRAVTWAATNGVVVQFAVTNVPASATNLMAIAAAGNSTLALRSNGTLVAWGGTDANLVTNIPPGLSNVTAIALGTGHALVVRSNGTVVAWGNNASGQTNIPMGLSNVIAVAAGSSHSLALKSDGTITAWGLGVNGQTNVPAGLSNVMAIAAAGTYNLALKSDGKVTAWGGSLLLTNVSASLSNVVAIAAGPLGAMALKADGTAFTWGNKLSNSVAPSSNFFAIATGGTQTPFYVALIGNGAPVMTVQPVSRIITNGTYVQMTGRAVGTQPLGYQWQHNGDDIPGATSPTLTITNAQGQDVGSYQLFASNALGTIASKVATLTIPFSTNLTTALDATNVVWINGASNTAWFAQNRVTHDGNTAAQSGPITNNQQSVLQTTITGPGTLTFWWKVSSEESYDFLRFYLDNLNTPVSSISGEVDWQQKTFILSAGTHTLKWVYAKDASVSAGDDAGWLDQVSFTPNPPIITTEPLSQTVPMGVSVYLHAGATSTVPLSFQWLKDGTNLPGATDASLTLPQVGSKDCGQYSLAASNAGGMAISSNATLLVRVPQRLGAPALQPDGSLVVICGNADGGQLQAGDAARFEAQASSDLVNWVALPSGALTVTNGALSVRDASGGSLARRFYRVVEHGANTDLLAPNTR